MQIHHKLYIFLSATIGLCFPCATHGQNKPKKPIPNIQNTPKPQHSEHIKVDLTSAKITRISWETSSSGACTYQKLKVNMRTLDHHIKITSILDQNMIEHPQNPCGKRLPSSYAKLRFTKSSQKPIQWYFFKPKTLWHIHRKHNEHLYELTVTFPEQHHHTKHPKGHTLQFKGSIGTTLPTWRTCDVHGAQQCDPMRLVIFEPNYEPYQEGRVYGCKRDGNKNEFQVSAEMCRQLMQMSP